MAYSLVISGISMLCNTKIASLDIYEAIRQV